MNDYKGEKEYKGREYKGREDNGREYKEHKGYEYKEHKGRDCKPRYNNDEEKRYDLKDEKKGPYSYGLFSSKRRSPVEENLTCADQFNRAKLLDSRFHDDDDSAAGACALLVAG